MRTQTLVLALLVCSGSALAQPEPRTETESSDSTAATEERNDVPIPPKLQPPSEQGAPTVSIRSQDNGDRVEEYRQNGRLYMVKVTPERAPPYYLLDTNGDGRLDAKDGEGRVAPVYWTIYEWD